jgi:hypothetical protein
MRAAWLMLPSLALGAGCLRQTEFRCATNEQCGPNGTCQMSVGYCSFPDSQCGERFGDSAGPYAHQCVNQTGGDAGIDASTDGPPAGCPPDFMLAPNAPAGSHVYKRLPTNANWGTQHDACTQLARKTYIAVPDDAAELTAIGGIAQAAIFWVGIDDRATEGAYVRSSDGATQTFLPWAANQPDNAGGGQGQDCVAATPPNISDEDCSGGAANKPAVCECEP